MKKSIKKEVSTTIESAIDQVLQVFDLKKTSRKTKRAIAKVSKRIQGDLKKQMKRTVGKIKNQSNGQATTSVPSAAR